MNLLEKVKELASKNYWDITEYILRNQETKKEYKRLILSKRLSNGEYRHIEINFETLNKIDRIWFRIRDFELIIHDFGIIAYIDQINYNYNLFGAYVQDKTINLEEVVTNLIIYHNPKISLWLYDFKVEIK